MDYLTKFELCVLAKVLSGLSMEYLMDHNYSSDEIGALYQIFTLVRDEAQKRKGR